MLASLAGWSFVVAALSLVLTFVGFIANFLLSSRAVRDERADRRKAMDDAWSMEWANQRPLVFPQLPSSRATNAGPYLKIKNGGRGPALNVTGKLTHRHGAGKHWGDVSTGALAAGDEESVEL